LGVRITLGAGRNRIIRQMLTESLLLALGGGSIGILLAYLSLRGLLQLDPGNIPRLNAATLDTRVLLFTATITLLASVLFGILPALSASRINPIEFLKAGGNRGVVRGHNRMQSRLVVAEVGLVFMLLAGAGLLLRSYVNVKSRNIGFSQSTVSMNIQLDGLYGQSKQRFAILQNIIDSIRAIRGVKAVGAINTLPLSKSNSFTFFWVDGYANLKDQLVELRTATPEYFPAMNIPLIEGRLLTDEDSSGHRAVVIVNQAFARKYLGDRDPIGRRVTIQEPHTPPKTVVGVVADVRHSSLEEESQPEIYSTWQDDATDAYFAVLSVFPPKEVVSDVRSAIRTVDPSLALADVRTMGELVSEASSRRRFQTTLIIVFAGVALVLAMVGLYGLLAYSVKQRTSEIGLHMALGASRLRVLSLILGEALRLVVAGLIVGFAGALMLTRVLVSSLYGVHALDPVTYILVPALLLVVTLAASLVPCWKAASVEPMIALRYE
jgi:predicted permease